MSDGGATPRTPRSPSAARCTTVTEGDSEEGSTARSGGSTPNPGAALRASSSGVVRTELSKVSEDGAAEEGSGKAAAPEAVRSSQQWLEREIELSSIDNIERLTQRIYAGEATSVRGTSHRRIYT